MGNYDRVTHRTRTEINPNRCQIVEYTFYQLHNIHTKFFYACLSYQYIKVYICMFVKIIFVCMLPLELETMKSILRQFSG